MVGASFTDLGMGRYTVRQVARDHSSGALYFTNLFSLRLALILVASVVTLLAALALGYRSGAFVTVIFACTYTLFVTLIEYARSMYEAFGRLRVQAGMLILEKLLVIGGGLGLLAATHRPQWTLAGMTAGIAVANLVSFRWISRNLAGMRVALLDWRFIGQTIRRMLLLGLGGLFFAMYFRVDLIFVEAILSERHAGQYGAAFRVLETLNMMPTIIVISGLYPHLSRLLGVHDFDSFRRVVRLGLAGISTITVGLAVALSLWGPDLIRLLDPNPEFAASGPVLQLLGWALPMLGINGLLYSALIALDDDAATAAILGMAVLLKTALDLWLIPSSGIVGAAQASVGTEAALILAFTARYLSRCRDFSRSGESRHRTPVRDS
jgi:O-antigen/teichoic acid export membrane protein